MIVTGWQTAAGWPGYRWRGCHCCWKWKWWRCRTAVRCSLGDSDRCSHALLWGARSSRWVHTAHSYSRCPDHNHEGTQSSSSLRSWIWRERTLNTHRSSPPPDQCRLHRSGTAGRWRTRQFLSHNECLYSLVHRHMCRCWCHPRRWRCSDTLLPRSHQCWSHSLCLHTRCSWLDGAFSPVNHKELQQGWKQTSVLSPSYPFHKSLHHKPLFLKPQLKLYPQFQNTDPERQ